MKIENIGKAHNLIEQREHILNVIEKLETDDITLTGEDGNEVDKLDECVALELVKLYKQNLEFIEEEIKQL